MSDYSKDTGVGKWVGKILSIAKSVVCCIWVWRPVGRRAVSDSLLLQAHKGTKDTIPQLFTVGGDGHEESWSRKCLLCLLSTCSLHSWKLLICLNWFCAPGIWVKVSVKLECFFFIRLLRPNTHMTYNNGWEIMTTACCVIVNIILCYQVNN